MTSEPFKHLLEKEWVVQSCEATQFLWSPPGVASTRTLKELFGDSYTHILAFVENGFGYWFYWSEDLDRLARRVVKEEQTRPGFVRELAEGWKKEHLAFLSECKTIDDADLAALPDAELAETFRRLYALYLRSWGISMLSDAFSLRSEALLAEYLLPLLEERGEERAFSRYLPILTSSSAPSFAMEETLESLALQADALHDPALRAAVEGPPGKRMHALRTFPSFFRKLTSHARKYFWLHNSYLRTRYLDESYFADRLADALKERKDPSAERLRLQQAPRRAMEEKQALLETLNPSQELAVFLRLLDDFAGWHDLRKKNNLVGDHYLALFLDEFCRRRNFTRRDWGGLLPEEYADALAGKLDAREMARRSSCSFVFFTVKGTQTVSGPSASALYRALQKETHNEVEDVRGTSASPGRAEGLVCVVRSTSDLPKMKPGNVLVCGMTRPELVPAMKKAVAIVTDEGGITSHAAIVSRELGLPCVIGTKIATKAFKDGDFVEVNANHGIVRKIRGSGIA